MNNNSLDNRFKLTFPANIQEAKKLGEFNYEIHKEIALRSIVPALYSDYPRVKPEFFPMIVEQSTDRIASSVMLIPWTYSICGVEVKVAELGMVGTLPEFRGLGLSSLLTRHFMDLAEEEGFQLSHIQGIPGFYRRYGYTYACKLQQGVVIDTLQIRDYLKDKPVIKYRKTKTVQETLDLFKSLNSSNKADITSVRSDSISKRIHEMMEFSPTFNEVFVTDAHKALHSGFTIRNDGFFPKMLEVTEAVAGDKASAAAILLQAAERAEELGKEQIKLGSTGEEVDQLALEAGGRVNRSYNFYMKVINPASLINQMRPLFNRRLALGAFKDYSGNFTFGSYGNNAFVLEIENGKVKSISETAEPKGYNLQFCSTLLPNLLLGTDSISELKNQYCDFWTGNLWYEENNQPLSEALFPKLTNDIRQVY